MVEESQQGKNKGWYVTYANGNWVIPKNVTEVDFRKHIK